MKHNLTLSLLLSVFVIIHAKTQTLNWVANFNGKANSNDAITAIAADASGNIYVTGYADNKTTGTDYVTIKYNSLGVQQWTAVYDGEGNGNDYANAICTDNAGNIYVTGTSDAQTAARVNNNAVTIKYNSAGKQLWVAVFDGKSNNNDGARAIKVDNAGNVYITGNTTSKDSGAYANIDYLTVKYDASGVQQWAATYNGNGPQSDQTDSANAIALDASGNVYVTGLSEGNVSARGNLFEDYLTVKYDASGNQLWTARFNGSAKRIDEAYAIATDKSGNVYVTGLSTGDGYEFATIKYNTDGTQQWIQTYQGAGGTALGLAITVDDKSNVYVTGSDDARPYNEDIFTIKYTTSGQRQWSSRYDGGDNDDANAIALDKYGNVYVTGYSIHADAGPQMIAIKYSNAGVKQWVQEYGNSNDFAWDMASSIVTDSSDNVYIAGYTTNSSGNTDYTLIQYSTGGSDTVSAPKKNNKDTFMLYQNNPNPFSSVTTIPFTIKESGKNPSAIKLWIEDASGKTISVLINAPLNNGSYSTQWYNANPKQGVYYSKLLCNGKIQSKKMLVAY